MRFYDAILIVLGTVEEVEGVGCCRIATGVDIGCERPPIRLAGPRLRCD